MKLLRLHILTLAFVLANVGKAQEIRIEKQTWDFGTVNNWRNDTAWFRVHNQSAKMLAFLPTHYNQNYKIIKSASYADPGESIDIGIIYYTDSRGKFQEKVPLYFNLLNDPLIFTLKGEIKSFSPDAQIRCPSVNDGSPADRPEKVITIEVRDLRTDILINPDKIFVTDHNNKKIKLEKSGLEFEFRSPPGIYRVVSEKSGYEDYSSSITLEPYKDRFIVYMEKKTDEGFKPLPNIVDSGLIDPAPRKPLELPKNNPRYVNPEEKHRDTSNEQTEWLEDPVEIPHQHPDTVKKDTFKPVLPEPQPIETGNLDSTKYRHNNLIIIVDISGSMKKEGKIENLKSSIISTVSVFRPDDRIGVIALNSNASVLQPPVAITEKDSLSARIQRMKAEGATNGGAALQLAYSLALQNYIPSGNNQVIICTDGVFSSGNMLRRELEKMIADNAVKGIKLSCVGFGSDPKAIAFMKHLSETGQGSFVSIQNDSETRAFLEMIKQQSAR